MARRDRLALPLWIAGIWLLVMATLISFEGLYPTEEARQAMAATMTNPAAIALTGPDSYLADYSIGAMLAHQMIGMASVVTALMSILLVVRHTRREEDTGRADLIRASVIGRHAQTSAALLLALGANILLAFLLTLSMGLLGVESVTWEGAMLFAASLASVGIVFASFAAVAAQFAEHARGATGLSTLALVVAFGLRAGGDIGNPMLSWLSPIGWAQQTLAFVDHRWAPLLLSLGVSTLLVAIAYPLHAKRDVGAGILQPRRGRSRASSFLKTPIGLAFRLQRIPMLVWSLGMLLIGFSYGSFISEAEALMDSMGDVLQDMLPDTDQALFVDSVAGMFMSIAAILASIPALQTVLRLRSEEKEGLVDALLSGSVTRTGLIGSYLVLAGLYCVVLVAMAGLGMGIAGSKSMNDPAYIEVLLVAGLNYVPALWVVTGVAAALLGLVPRIAGASWFMIIYAFLAVYLGGVLQLPEWMIRLSPFYYVPQLPAEAFQWPPLIGLTAFALLMAVAGWAGFCRRDLSG